MISIAEMKTLAEKEVKPKLMEYIEKCIYNGLKYNNKIGLYKSHVKDIFNPINKYGGNVLIYLVDTTLEPYDAYSTALKELADEVRQELFDAGVVKITKNKDSCFTGEPYLFLEV